MFQIQLKDGSQKTFDQPISGLDLAQSISSSLAKKATVIRVNGELWDLSRELPNGGSVDILTREDPDVLDIIRHDAAHILAQAVKELYPKVQITIGPSIENGFYYDIQSDKPFTPEDLEVIEARMREIVDADEPFIREVWERDDAIAFFKKMGEHFKAEIIESIPQNERISLYRQGTFIDLCRGPHMPTTKFVGHAFKLMKVAGSYWRGDSNNPMLQRIYGTAWAKQEDLKDYLYRLEEAEKRDHRKLGVQLELFHLQEEAPGSVFWHEKGWKLYRKLESYLRSRLEEHDYIEVKTPQILDQSLWEASGHWEKFHENMFVIPDKPRAHVVKPMNCPCHVQIFKKGIKSYRDLPLRMAEFGSCHRNEPTGALHGLMRVRAFTQDDAHIFCELGQITEETKKFCDLLKLVYKDLGFEDVRIKFSDRPEKRAGSDEVWDQAESALKEASLEAGIEYSLNPGEGAFYGPKLEFVLRDAIGRDWQCGTLQVDFVLPERLDAHYVDRHGEKQRPVMLHRAILGSFERFLGILIEHYEGKFPLWLSPIQVAVCTINDDCTPYAQSLCEALNEANIDYVLDDSNEKISYKVREYSMQKVPYILVVGKNEMDSNTVTLRTLGSKDTRVLTVHDFIGDLLEKLKVRALDY